VINFRQALGLQILILLFIGFGPQSYAMAESFNEFSVRAKSESDIKSNDGLSYMLSGGLALVGGGYGFSQSEKPVEKGFYSIAQSLGLLAIGYGAEAYFLKHDDEIFIQVLNSADLTREQKDRMVESYLKEKRDREEDMKWIRRTTFGLAGALNIIYAGQTKDSTLRGFLYLTAGLQLVWAFTF
jgi:hypothetical protein